MMSARLEANAKNNMVTASHAQRQRRSPNAAGVIMRQYASIGGL
jgi:hypothetical protein